jgi:anti-anti-sigma factor
MASTRIQTERAGTGTVATLLTPSISPFDLAPLEHDLKQSAAETAWRIAVDLTQVEMMGSQALGMLINLRKEALANKGKVVLFGLNDDLQEMLKITRLSAIFTIAKDKSAAIAAMA